MCIRDRYKQELQINSVFIDMMNIKFIYLKILITPLSFKFLIKDNVIGNPKSPKIPKKFNPISMVARVTTGCNPT